MCQGGIWREALRRARIAPARLAPKEGLALINGTQVMTAIGTLAACLAGGTVAVRIELPNPGNLLKPGMFAQVELPVGAKNSVVTVPMSAVIDSGARGLAPIAAATGLVPVGERRVSAGLATGNSVQRSPRGIRPSRGSVVLPPRAES